jgi:zinc protease
MSIGPHNITRAVLKNGIVVLVYENPASPSVVVRGHLRAGSLFDPPEMPGLAAFTADMLEEGTRKRSSQQIADETESLGAAVGFGAGVHLVGFSGKALAEDLRLLLDMLSDIVQHATFPADKIEQVRGEILTSLREREDSTAAMAGLTFRKLAYPNHPYGRDSLGSVESVSAIRRKDLKRFYEETYRPEGMEFAIVGDVRVLGGATKTVALVEKYFGAWQGAGGASPPFVIPPAKPLAKPQRQHIRMKTKIQSDLVLGAPALARTHPDFLAAEMADVILGEFGLMGRLGDNVRDRLGLAYYSRSQLEAAPGPGAWSAYAGVAPGNVEQAVEAILFEMKRLKTERVDEAELDDIKSFMTGIQPLRLESNDGIAAALLDMEFYGLGLDYVLRLPERIRAVSAEEVQAAAQKYLPTDRYALVVAGP